MTARWNNLPGRCKCSHSAVTHLRGQGRCYSTVCACQGFRDAVEIAAAEARHPAGKAGQR